MKQNCALALSLIFLSTLQLSWLGAVQAETIWPPLVTDLGGCAVAVDASGNVYVTGTIWYVHDEQGSFDYATIKYDANGNDLWARKYNGPVNEDDIASAMAVDGAGNVYVTGSSKGALHRIGLHDIPTWDYATVKYDKDGNELWVARYDGPYDDWAAGIALDSDDNAYVTGSSAGSHGLDDYATVKYDTNGNELWVARYDGPGNGFDYASAIAVDNSGNAYVTGEASSGNWNDFATVKYDANGDELWVAMYDGPAKRRDGAKGITIDGGGNIYVTGRSVVLSNEYDYATVKYDTNGNELWARTCRGSGKGSYWAQAIAVDSSGNVYVAGCSNYYSATVKYDADGSELWVGEYKGGSASDIAVDGAGNVYVSGEELHGSRVSKIFEFFHWRSWKLFRSWRDYATIKYNSAGERQWVVKYNGQGRDYNWARAIAADGNANVYVTGVSTASEDPSFWYTTVKYGSNGDEKWVARYDPWGYNDD